jgi:predicted nucleotidyltransferase
MGNSPNLGVETLIKKSLSYCVEKSSIKDTKEAEERIRNNDGAANSTFRYALGKGICEQLALYYGEIKACYLFGSSLSDTANVTSDIDLIIEVTRKSSALSNFVAQLDKRILDYYKANMNGSAKGILKMLDIYFVDDTDIRDRRGFASIIQSTHSPPIKIVERK